MILFIVQIPDDPGVHDNFEPCAMAYLKPASELKSIVDVVLSVFYTVVPPSVNPIIYSLRNKDIK
ncbi:Olfactory Receptor 14A16, partial [Manis pentadactyla]